MKPLYDADKLIKLALDAIGDYAVKNGDGKGEFAPITIGAQELYYLCCEFIVLKEATRGKCIPGTISIFWEPHDSPECKCHQNP